MDSHKQLPYGFIPPPLASGPQLAIEGAVLDRLRDMFSGDGFRAGQVGDGAGDLEHPVVGAGAEVQIGHGKLQEFEDGRFQPAVLLELARVHARVARGLRPLFEPLLLPPSGRHHPVADFPGVLARAVARDLAKVHRRHFDVQIDPVEQGTGNAAQITLDFARRAARFAGHFSIWSVRCCLFATGL